jgi:acetyl esterase
VEIDPQTQELLAGMAAGGGPPLYEMSPVDARGVPAFVATLIGDGPAVASVRDITIPVRDAQISARVYEPEADPTATIVYFHGGGWVIGTVDQWDASCRALAVAAGARLVSVEYRLAPEHRFPTAADDCFDATVWIAENLAEGTPLVVAGDSAGGNLATVTAMRARDEGGPAIAFQLLVYPVVDHDFTRDSYERYAEGNLIVTRKDMVWFWDHYAPNVHDRSHPHASPLRADDLSGLPPAHFIFAEHDPLLDEGQAYAARLEAAGVPVTSTFFPGQIHAFFTLLNLLDSAAAGCNDGGQAVRAAVAS